MSSSHTHFPRRHSVWVSEGGYPGLLAYRCSHIAYRLKRYAISHQRYATYSCGTAPDFDRLPRCALASGPRAPSTESVIQLKSTLTITCFTPFVNAGSLHPSGPTGQAGAPHSSHSHSMNSIQATASVTCNGASGPAALGAP